MSDQVEVKEKIRWEDLEVEEEPRYFEGLGDAAAEMHQAICEERLRLKELKVAEKQETTEREKGNEPVPTFQQSLKDLSEYDGGYDPAKVGADLMQGVLLVFGISEEEFAEAMEGRARAALEQELRFAEIPMLGAVDWREANERLPRINEMVSRINAFCTPSRINLTGEWGVPNAK